MGWATGFDELAVLCQQMARAVDKSIRKGAGCLHYQVQEFPDGIRSLLETTKRADSRWGLLIEDAGRRFSAAARDHNLPTSGAWTPRDGELSPFLRREPHTEAQFLTSDIEDQIRYLEGKLGIHTDAQRALELSLYMEDKFRDIALISRQTRPEAIFDGGLNAWAGWLDARLFARQNLHREMSVDFLQEIHRRILVRYDPENAGRLKGPEASNMGTGNLGRPASPSELAAFEENPLLTYVPGPVTFDPYGVVLEPKVEGQPGARVMRWLDKEPTAEELAAIEADPLRGYKEPVEWARKYGTHGMIVYPNFGTEERSREYLQSLCDQYNYEKRQPDFNPYRSAAQFQKDVISAHRMAGDMAGRASRVAMNHLLEQAGKPPSALVDFDDDLFMPSRQYADAVEAGSNRYGQWQQRIERSGPDIDPVDLTDLRPMMHRYQEMGGEPSPFAPGKSSPSDPQVYHDKEIYGQLHAQLRSAQ